jgi:hypothetical protein
MLFVLQPVKSTESSVDVVPLNALLERLYPRTSDVKSPPSKDSVATAPQPPLAIPPWLIQAHKGEILDRRGSDVSDDERRIIKATPAAQRSQRANVVTKAKTSKAGSERRHSDVIIQGKSFVQRVSVSGPSTPTGNQGGVEAAIEAKRSLMVSRCVGEQHKDTDNTSPVIYPSTSSSKLVYTRGGMQKSGLPELERDCL